MHILRILVRIPQVGSHEGQALLFPAEKSFPFRDILHNDNFFSDLRQALLVNAHPFVYGSVRTGTTAGAGRRPVFGKDC